MKEVAISGLVNLLGEPLIGESVKGSEIHLLKQSLQIPRGGGISQERKEELKKRFYALGLPEGIISLPVQYCNGEYTDMGEKDFDKTFLSQGLATVFHPDFYEGNGIKCWDGSPHRPLIDGYLDFRDDHVLSDYVDQESDEFDRAYEFKNGLWIGGLAEDDAENLVREHIKQFAKLYKIREFLREPEKSLVSKSFSPYFIY